MTTEEELAIVKASLHECGNLLKRERRTRKKAEAERTVYRETLEHISDDWANPELTVLAARQALNRTVD